MHPYLLRLYGHGRLLRVKPTLVTLEDDGEGGHVNLLAVTITGLPAGTVDTVELRPAGHPGPVWGLAASPPVDVHGDAPLILAPRALRVPALTGG